MQALYHYMLFCTTVKTHELYMITVPSASKMLVDIPDRERYNPVFDS